MMRFSLRPRAPLLLAMLCMGVERVGAARITRRAALSLPAAAALSPLYASADESPLPLVAPASAADEAEVALAPPEAPPAPLAPPAPPPPPVTSAYSFDVPFRGEPKDIDPFLAKANLVVNVKLDDPITRDQMPGLGALLDNYASKGLHVLAFPTDQGWFEAEDNNKLRLMFKEQYNFGQFPNAVVFDKADLLGTNALPLYAWLTTAFPNPWGVTRIVFNYEKFLLDGSGQPLRRYPRKFPISLIEPDVEAVLAGQPLPPPSERYLKAWEDAKREAIKSEYAFKPGLNYYKTGSPAS